MRLATSQLPAVQFITIPPELEEPYNQEIFQEVVVTVTDVGQEERDVLVAMTGQAYKDPSLTPFASQSPPSTSSLLPHQQPRPPDTK